MRKQFMLMLTLALTSYGITGNVQSACLYAGALGCGYFLGGLWKS